MRERGGPVTRTAPTPTSPAPFVRPRRPERGSGATDDAASSAQTQTRANPSTPHDPGAHRA
ncbi:hypothetical protein BJP65_06740 [Microbacterium sp. BH-3-3-3]|nr:hypothetical protein BJP65_06740 [Microbacterium sp. BH-3-3-3]